MLIKDGDLISLNVIIDILREKRTILLQVRFFLLLHVGFSQEENLTCKTEPLIV